jgi:peroxiredoxin Q/BCP
MLQLEIVDGEKMLREGDSAPDFSLPDAGGKMVKLSDFSGKFVVLYFYPKDDTPGCTVEACGFRDMKDEYEKMRIVVLGISPDDSAPHSKFAEKYRLPFTLLADEGAKIAEKYGAWGEKEKFGKKYMGVYRTTFVIGKDGRVAKVFEKVKPEGHNSEVLRWIEANRH